MNGRVTVSRVASAVRGLRNREGSRYKDIRNIIMARTGVEPSFFDLKAALSKGCASGVIKRDKVTGRFLPGTRAGNAAGTAPRESEGLGYTRRRRGGRRKRSRRRRNTSRRRRSRKQTGRKRGAGGRRRSRPRSKRRGGRR